MRVVGVSFVKKQILLKENSFSGTFRSSLPYIFVFYITHMNSEYNIK
jgi:hypothetical protein